MEESTPTVEPLVESIVKERKKPNITPEDRARRAERMREMATSRNELLKKQKAERIGGTTLPQTPTLETHPEKKPRVKKQV